MGNESSTSSMSTQKKQGQQGQQSQPPQLPPQIQNEQYNQPQGYQQQQQQMQFPVQGYMNNNNNTNYAPQMLQQEQAPISSGSGFRLLQFTNNNTNDKKDTKQPLKLAAVIVTICDGSSYDALFSSVKQDAGDGSRVSVYQCSKSNISDLMKHFDGKNDDILSRRKDDLKLLISDLREIQDSSCVAFNYECCSGCNDNGFQGTSSKQIISELQFFLSKGYLVMYSDFSLKAIIKSWNDIGDKTNIGPNPFIRCGDWNNTVTLNFNPFLLKECVSTQLQAVGELCPDQDFCTVHCMGGTVKYSIKNKFNMEHLPEDLPYDLEILYIAKFEKHSNSCCIKVPDFESIKKDKETKGKNDKMDVVDEELEKEIDLTKLPMRTLYGDAGHVVLDYAKNRDVEVDTETQEGKADDDGEEEGGKGGVKGEKLCGKILLSMTHWCELVKLGDQINDDVLFKVAAKNMGVESAAYQQMQETYESMGGKNATGKQQKEQKMWVSKQANMMVQQQAPCNNGVYGNYSKSSKSKKYGY